MPIQFNCPTCGKALQVPNEIAGQTAKCPGCSTSIRVPENNFAIKDERPAPPPRRRDREEEGPGRTSGAGDDRRPCPMCGEMISISAVKCRFCGEIFDEDLRRSERKRGGGAYDSDLSVGEWVLAILLPGIGCIMGIVFLIQGKSKAGKMIGISLLFGILWNVIVFAIRSAARR